MLNYTPNLRPTQEHKLPVSLIELEYNTYFFYHRQAELVVFRLNTFLYIKTMSDSHSISKEKSLKSEVI